MCWFKTVIGCYLFLGFFYVSGVAKLTVVVSRCPYKNEHQHRCVYPEGYALVDDRNISGQNVLHCEPEDFVHDYLLADGEVRAHNNSWKSARAGESVGLRDVCLKPNGLPVTRKCLLLNGRVVWQNITTWPRVKCIQAHENTLQARLNSLHNEILGGKRRLFNAEGKREVTKLLRSMLRQRKTRLLPADVHEASQILKTVADANDADIAQDVLNICSSFMSSDMAVLRLSANLNATNSLLSTFEAYMDKIPMRVVPPTNCGQPLAAAAAGQSSLVDDVESIDFRHIGVMAHISKNLSVLFVNPSCANITGIAIYTQSGATRQKSHLGYWYRFLHSNESIAALQAESGLEVAAFLPEALWKAVHDELSAAKKNPYLVLKFYAHDALFVETVAVRYRRPHSPVLSISIPNYGSILPAPLPFLLRNKNLQLPEAKSARNGTGCGYWNYDTWVNDGVFTSSDGDTMRAPVIVCSTQHLTQFSYLLGGSYRQADYENEIYIVPMHQKVLDIISMVGCSLSLLGLCGIWVTAVLFPAWRKQASTKILLNLCVALTLQMVLFLFVNTDDISEALVSDRDYHRCVALGAMMQYSILVLFCWMLIVAILQFQRYVTVIGIKRPEHYIIKSAIAAWGLPLIPTILVACINPESYIPTEEQLETNSGICYPSGLDLTLGVVLPVSLITIANLFVFIYVFYSISYTLSQTMQRTERSIIIKQIRLSILLFFLLGLTWIFGLFSFMRMGIVFSYLFCLTATLQGFVIFIFFVLLDPVMRDGWAQLLCPVEDGRKPKNTSELRSMTTSSTNTHSRSHN